ncbi:hypothetical protein DFH28DRAFT_926252 [Melampsora americana]|nr:hypothetical protein DFH28DRAFT_926252 [Melampsora americana]
MDLNLKVGLLFFTFLQVCFSAPIQHWRRHLRRRGIQSVIDSPQDLSKSGTIQQIRQVIQLTINLEKQLYQSNERKSTPNQLSSLYNGTKVQLKHLKTSIDSTLRLFAGQEGLKEKKQNIDNQINDFAAFWILGADSEDIDSINQNKDDPDVIQSVQQNLACSLHTLTSDIISKKLDSKSQTQAQAAMSTRLKPRDSPPKMKLTASPGQEEPNTEGLTDFEKIINYLKSSRKENTHCNGIAGVRTADLVKFDELLDTALTEPPGASKDNNDGVEVNLDDSKAVQADFESESPSKTQEFRMVLDAASKDLDKKEVIDVAEVYLQNSQQSKDVAAVPPILQDGEVPQDVDTTSTEVPPISQQGEQESPSDVVSGDGEDAPNEDVIFEDEDVIYEDEDEDEDQNSLDLNLPDVIYEDEDQISPDDEVHINLDDQLQEVEKQLNSI